MSVNMTVGDGTAGTTVRRSSAVQVIPLLLFDSAYLNQAGSDAATRNVAVMEAK
jgi:hypothetical protein